jgi:hypothetical protein
MSAGIARGFRSARPIQSCIHNQRAGVRFQKEEGRCGDFGAQIITAAEMTAILGEALGYLATTGWGLSLLKICLSDHYW